MPSISWTREECLNSFQSEVSSLGDLSCNATWDNFLCWPSTRAGEKIFLPCPPLKGVDPSKFAFRRCDEEGRWEGRVPGQYSAAGWTNYTDCFTSEIKGLFNRLYSSSEEDADVKLSVARGTRLLEMIGLSLSFMCLLMALIIFCRFRILQNNRTKIHVNLFISTLLQVIIRLVVYADQYITRNFWKSNSTHQGIDNTFVLCEASYILLEYSRTTMFVWMFIEGWYLNNIISFTVFQAKTNLNILYAIGWGMPVIMIVTWASFTAVHYSFNKCWFGYNFTPYFWILEGPRLAVIGANMIFLLNIIRVLVTKLRESHTSEAQQVRKAVKAAIVLLPLLGITNFLSMVDTPLERSPWEFAIWSYTTHFMTSFQGCFITCLYCFLNGEVRSAVAKRWRSWNSNSSNTYRATPQQHMSISSGMVTLSEGEPVVAQAGGISLRFCSCCSNDRFHCASNGV